jgi:PRMT5 TIM barrel domain
MLFLFVPALHYSLSLFSLSLPAINTSSTIILTTFRHITGFIDKWISEPLRAIIISSKLFSVNKKKKLFLPPRMQQILVVLCAKFQVGEITLYAEKSFEALYTFNIFVLLQVCAC